MNVHNIRLKYFYVICYINVNSDPNIYPINIIFVWLFILFTKLKLFTLNSINYYFYKKFSTFL